MRAFLVQDRHGKTVLMKWNEMLSVVYKKPRSKHSIVSYEAQARERVYDNMLKC